MNRILSILLLVVMFNSASAQDTAKHEDLAYLKYCLKRHVKEYHLGASVTMIGVFTGIAAGFVAAKEPKTQQALLIAGGAISATGLIIVFDSHKWFERAAIGPRGKSETYLD